MKICQKCGFQNKDGYTFCSNCGSDLPQNAPAQSQTNVKTCPNCGFQNHGGAKFCLNCGNNLEAAFKQCPRCGYQNNVSATFCIGCGNKLVEDTPAQPQESPQNRGAASQQPQANGETSYDRGVLLGKSTAPASNTKTCPQCGFQNNENTSFCINCGTKLEEEKIEQNPANEDPSYDRGVLLGKNTSQDVKTCPECGYENKNDATFCSGCGNRLEEEILEQPQTAEETVMEEETVEEVEEVIEEPVEEEAEEDIDESEEETVEEVEEDIDDLVEEATEETTEQDIDDLVEEATEETTEQDIDDPVEEATEETTEEDIDESVEEETVEEVEDDIDEPLEEVTDEDINESTEEETSEETNEIKEETQTIEETAFDVGVLLGKSNPQETPKAADVKTCPQCGFENKNDVTFCISCGNKLDATAQKPQTNATPEPAKDANVKTCPQCGFENKNDVTFCISCGNKLDATAQKPQTNATPEPAKDANVKTCPQCGFENKNDVTFCISCGNKLNATAQKPQTNTTPEPAQDADVKVCPQCGFKNSKDVTFCIGCGNSFDNSNQTQPQAPINQNINNAQTNYPENPKFIKKEKKVAKKISKNLCPLHELFLVSTNPIEYAKTAEYFEQWVSEFVVPGLPKLTYFAMRTHWIHYRDNCITGIFALMVGNEYERCLKQCNILIENEEVLYSKGIGATTAGGLVSSVKTLAALTGKTGTDEEIELMNKIKLSKAICLCELGRYQEAYDTVLQLPPNYSFHIKVKDEYFAKNFKYYNKCSVTNVLYLVNNNK